MSKPAPEISVLQQALKERLASMLSAGVSAAEAMPKAQAEEAALDALTFRLRRYEEALRKCWDCGQTHGEIRRIVDSALVAAGGREAPDTAPPMPRPKPGTGGRREAPDTKEPT